MKDRLIEKIHPTLLEMWLVTALYGCAAQIVICIVAKQRLYYSIGLWAGVATAVLCGGLMLHGIRGALDRDEKSAVSYSYRQYALRAAIVLAVFLGLAFFSLQSVVGMFIGFFSLKISAYLQPWVHRLPIVQNFLKLSKEERES